MRINVSRPFGKGTFFFSTTGSRWIYHSTNGSHWIKNGGGEVHLDPPATSLLLALERKMKQRTRERSMLIEIGRFPARCSTMCCPMQRFLLHEWFILHHTFSVMEQQPVPKVSVSRGTIFTLILFCSGIIGDCRVHSLGEQFPPGHASSKINIRSYRNGRT